MKTVFRTERLEAVRADASHVDLFFSLWTDPAIMKNVGFPQGIPISREELAAKLSRQPDSDFDRLIALRLSGSGEWIGECALHPPDERGIASTDVKLLPDFQGKGYGSETKRALLDYLFRNTDCSAVEATPNVGNIASIRMQESVGGVRTGEGTFEFPESMRSCTCPVRHFVYTVYRCKEVSPVPSPR